MRAPGALGGRPLRDHFLYVLEDVRGATLAHSRHVFLDSEWNAAVLSNTSGGAEAVQAKMRELVDRVR